MTHVKPGPAMQVGDAVVFSNRNEFLVDNQTRRVKPKAMIVFNELMKGKGEVLSKQALMDAAWPLAEVSESVLTEAIHELRQALSDDARSPRYIKTIPRVGYCLVAQLKPPGSALPANERSAFPRIAVASFESIGPDEEDRYFCEGLCEELTGQLGKHQGIEVLARTTSMLFAEGQQDALETASEMGVSHLIGGSLRREGADARIIAHLTEVASGRQLWSDVFDKKLEHLLALQREIAETVCQKVLPRLSDRRKAPESAENAESAPSSSAFREFSKGRYFWKRDNLNPQRALGHYQAALEMDPNFAAPYAGIVECLNTLAVFHVAPQEPMREDAIRFAEQALFLAPNDPETLFAFGYMQFYMRWDWETARQALNRCLDINPNHPLAHGFLALLHAALREEQASREHALAQTHLDPFSTVAWLHLALHHRYFQNFEQSLDAAREGLELRASDVVLKWIEIDSLIRLGEGEPIIDAVLDLEKRTAENYPMFHALTGLQFRMFGNSDGLARIEQRLERHFETQWPDPFIRCLLALNLGETEKALNSLDAAFETRDAALWLINCDPTFDLLKDQPRLADLRKRMKLP